MTKPPAIEILPLESDAVAGFAGRVVVFLPESGKLDQGARRVNRLTRGALERFAASDPYVLRGLVTSWSVRPWNVVVGGAGE